MTLPRPSPAIRPCPARPASQGSCCPRTPLCPLMLHRAPSTARLRRCRSPLARRRGGALGAAPAPPLRRLVRRRRNSGCSPATDRRSSPPVVSVRPPAAFPPPTARWPFPRFFPRPPPEPSAVPGSARDGCGKVDLQKSESGPGLASALGHFGTACARWMVEPVGVEPGRAAGGSRRATIRCPLPTSSSAACHSSPRSSASSSCCSPSRSSRSGSRRRRAEGLNAAASASRPPFGPCGRSRSGTCASGPGRCRYRRSSSPATGSARPHPCGDGFCSCKFRHCGYMIPRQDGATAKRRTPSTSFEARCLLGSICARHAR